MRISRRDFMKLATTSAALVALDWDRVVRAAAQAVGKGKYNIIWFEAQSCTGDTSALLLATDPDILQVLAGHLHAVGPGTVNLAFHDAVMPEWGKSAMAILYKAIAGELDPFVLVVEGTIAVDEKAGGPPGSDYWCYVGKEDGKPVPCLEWIRRLMKKAAAVVAVGNCSSYGGIYSNRVIEQEFFKKYGFTYFLEYPKLGRSMSPTGCVGFLDNKAKGFKGLLSLLGEEAEPYRRFLEGRDCKLLQNCKPFVSVPGCPANGDATLKTLAHVVLALEGLMPLTRDQFDELARPKYFFLETTHNNCPRAGHYAAGRWRKYPGDGSQYCLWGVGCKGPVSHCPWNRLGWVSGIGGCVRQGSVCMGCHEPGFSDSFEPFYEKLPYVFASTRDLFYALAGAAAAAAVIGVASGTLAYLKSKRGGSHG